MTMCQVMRYRYFSCLVSIVFFSCIVQDFLYNNMDIGASCTLSQSIGLVLGVYAVMVCHNVLLLLISWHRAISSWWLYLLLFGFLCPFYCFNLHWMFLPGPTFIKPDQRNPWIKDQLWNNLLSTILHLQLPNFVSCGRDKPSHMTQNLVTVGVKL